MSYHGWIWHPRTKQWERVCKEGTVSTCARTLDRLHPGLPNLHYAITGGQVPGWTPGKFYQ